MPQRRVLIGLAIVAFWAVMTSLLLKREVLLPHALPNTPSLPASQRPTTDSWMGIYTKNELGGDDRVGYVHLTSAPGQRGKDSGTRNGMTLRLETRMLNEPIELTLDGSAWVTDAKGLSDFDFRVQSFGEHVMHANGKMDSGHMKLNVETAGETFPLDFPVGKDLMLQGAFGATTLNVPSLEVGDMVLVDAFDPVTLSKGVATVKCIGTENLDYDGQQVPTKVLTTELGGVTTKTWVGMNEEVMRVETPVGLVLRKISQHEALKDLDRSESGELLHSVAVRPKGAKPFPGAKEMRFKVSGMTDSLVVPTDDVQTEDGPEGFKTIMADTPTPPVAEVDAAKFADNLEADPFVQTGHPKIVKQARAIVGDEKDPWRKSLLIYQWVFDTISKEPLLSIPSALDVLESRKGDCNEHTVLFAALARSEHIPTRIAIGLVWSGELNGFYYHAWPEVYVGRWVPMDPTLGQPIADATHIKLLEGSVVQWPRLVPFLGQVSIDVLDVR